LLKDSNIEGPVSDCRVDGVPRPPGRNAYSGGTMEITVRDWLEAVHHEVELRRWRDESAGQWKSLTTHNELP